MGTHYGVDANHSIGKSHPYPPLRPPTVGNFGLASEAIDAARWMHPGDLAVMDEEGYVTIVGRSKDMVKS